jgi:hypothetical protein
MYTHSKEINYIKSMIKMLNLNLKELTVLTEIGSSYYFYLPFIAALSGAKKVYAWTSNNNYFDCYQIVNEAKELAKKLNLQDLIEFSINKRPYNHIANADIITNSGFIRPLDENFLRKCKRNVAISLMFEAWELREKDIDIEYCKQNLLKVGGIWENHPDLEIFEAVGPLAIKLAMEAGNEIYQNKIIIWSEDEFGVVTKKYFEKLRAKSVILTVNNKDVYDNLHDADFIYFCPNHEQRVIFGKEINAILDIDKIKSINPNISIVHLYGAFDYNSLKETGVKIYPPQDGKAEIMSRTLTYLGMKPSLNLLIGGLKVGDEIKNNKISSLTQII